MAYPTIHEVTTYASSSQATSHNLNLPATVNAGDLLLLIFAFRDNTSISGLTGFSHIGTSVTSGTDSTISCYAKVAVGNEDGTTISVGIGGSIHCVSQCYRIQTGTWYGSLTGVEAQTTSSDNTDPPSLTASWGSAENLWIAGIGQDEAATGSAPTNYTNLTSTASSSSPVGVGMRTARRNNTTATEDPGTMSSSSAAISITIVVRPVVAGTDYEQSVDGTMGAVSGTNTLQTNKPLAGTAGAVSGAIVKEARKALAGIAGALTGSIVKEGKKALSGAAGALSGALSGSRLIVSELAGELGTMTGSLVRETQKALSGTAGAVSGAISKITNTNMAGTLGDLLGEVSTVLTGLILKSVGGTLGTVSGSISRITEKGLAGASGALTATINKLTYKTFYGDFGSYYGGAHYGEEGYSYDAFLGDVTKRTNKPLAGTLGSITGAIANGIGKALAGAMGIISGSLTKSFVKQLAGTLGALTGSVTKAWDKTLAGTLGELTGSVSNSPVYIRLLEGTITLSGSLHRALKTAVMQKLKGGYNIITRIKGGTRLF